MKSHGVDDETLKYLDTFDVGSLSDFANHVIKEVKSEIFDNLPDTSPQNRKQLTALRSAGASPMPDSTNRSIVRSVGLPIWS